ncbi:MAG TPA: DUF1801 domain-containing protein [Candidatus Limnocylindrales bacterium]|nr:DUF1801 domain-containing protein [Candidatus Limnocylindrales bacterium]
MPDTKSTAKSSGKSAAPKSGKVWTDEEKEAMKEHAREVKAQAKAGKDKDAGLKDVLAKFAEMPPSDRAMAEKLHEIVKANAPDLSPKTWYGMPAYANKDGKVVCFFTPAAKFKERYATLGFNADAHLDEGSMWPTSWALTKISAADEARIVELVKKAVS